MPDLNFDRHNTLYATHGLHAYAAKCPPQLVGYGLRYYSKTGEKVLDPMAGSGTTLVEARLMGRHALGIEIDPLARLIAQVKSRKVNDSVLEQAFATISKRVVHDLSTLRSRVTPEDVRHRAMPPDFPNRGYWFSPDVSTSLALLSYHVGNTPMPKNARDFFWVAFSSLILAKTSVANARDIIHSRHHYWQHPVPPDVLNKFTSRVERMRKQMADFRTRCADASHAIAEARLGDARRLRLQDETIDLVFTSPPYATALDYTRAHFLAVAWMQNALGISLENYRAKASTYVGSERGRKPSAFQIDERLAKLELTHSVITQLAAQSPSHALLIQRYFVDMHQVFSEIARVLKTDRHAIIVVCPSHIRKMEVPTHSVFVEIGRALGLKLKKNYTRTINQRRRILPYIQEAFGKRMDTEYVLVFQKAS